MFTGCIDADRQDSEPVVGRLRTAPRDRRDVTIAWSGNVVGQSWGIDPDTGGMTGFEAVRRRQPDSSSTPATTSTPTGRCRSASS